MWACLARAVSGSNYYRNVVVVSASADTLDKVVDEALTTRSLLASARDRTATAGVVVGVALVLTACGGSDVVARSPGTQTTGSQRVHGPAAATRISASVAPFRLPATLSRAVAVASAPGSIEVLGGLHDGERSTNAVIRIDLRSGSVTVPARLPVAVHDAAGGLVAGVPTVLGGGNSAEVAAIQQADAAGTGIVGRLPFPSSDVVAAATDRGLVLVGGYDGRRTLGQVLLVTGPDRVERIGTLAVSVRYPAVVTTGSGTAQRVLVIGGESGGVATDIVQQVDPATGNTTVVGHLPAPRTQASALLLAGSVFVFGGASGGRTGATVFADVLRWNPLTRTFAPAGSLPYPVADAAFVTPDGHTGYLVGGETPSRVATTIIVVPGG